MRWTQVVAVGVAAVLTVVVLDALAQRAVPVLPSRIEVADGVAAYEGGDPAVLVLGSSHSRGFSVIEQRLAERFGRPDHMVRVAVEYGKLSSYRWVLEHRLRPLIEQADASGALVRPSLERLVLITEWWDSCRPAGGLAENVPARAWTARHFVADAAAQGLTDFNRNWLSYQWTSRMTGSLLVSDRGVGRLPMAALDALRGGGEARAEAERQLRVDFWRGMIEGGADDPSCFHPEELADLEAIVRYFQGRGVDVTVMLQPRMPITLTELATRTTVAHFEGLMRALTARLGVRLVDFTTSTPLTDDDYMADFDHTSASGNERLADFGLAGELGFLLERHRSDVPAR